MTTRRDKHVQLMKPVVKHYQKIGYRCIIVHRPTPDFIAIKEGKVIAVEVNAYGAKFDFKKFRSGDLGADEINWVVMYPNRKFTQVHDNNYRITFPRCPWCGKLLKYKESTRVWKCSSCGRDLIARWRRQHRKRGLERSKPA